MNKLNGDDEGAMLIAVGIENNTVRIDFQKPTTWFALYKNQAIAFGEMLIEKANEIDKPKSH